MLKAELTDRKFGFRFTENTDDLFVGKTLLNGNVVMWLMKTLLTSGYTIQRGAGQMFGQSQFIATRESLLSGLFIIITVLLNAM